MTPEQFNTECERRLEDFQKTLDRMAEDAARKIKSDLITNYGNRVYLSKFEAAGLLNVDPRTVVMSKVPHVNLTGTGASVRFLLSDVLAEVRKTKTKKES